MNHNPKISIITTAYNAENYIGEAIESILNQTFTDFEYIIIDDASTDNTFNIILKYAKLDNRIFTHKNDENLNVTKSRNYGLSIAKGEYIAVQDADDISMIERLSVQLSYLEKNKNIFLLGTGAIIIDEFGSKIGVYKSKTGTKKIEKILPYRNCIYHPSIMFRNVGYLYREKILNAEDYDLYLLLLSDMKKINNLSTPLIKYRILKNSLSRKKELQQVLFTEKVKEFYKERVFNGRDSYDFFDQKVYENPNHDEVYSKQVTKTLTSRAFHSKNYQEVNTQALKYFRYYGLSSKVLLFYILSCTWIITHYSIHKFENYLNFLRK